MTHTERPTDPRAAAIRRAVADVDYEAQRIEKERADRTRLVNLMFAIHRLDWWSRRCSKAEVSTWHTDTVAAIHYLTMALPTVHSAGSPALQKRVYAEIQTLANRLMDEKRWEAKT